MEAIDFTQKSNNISFSISIAWKRKKTWFLLAQEVKFYVYIHFTGLVPPGNQNG